MDESSQPTGGRDEPARTPDPATGLDTPALDTSAVIDAILPDAPPPADAAGNGKDDVYRVELDVFSGPLDLLLYLIKKEELDIYDIPISKILGQYMAHLELLKLMELDEVGDFLVMAANLMLIKARMLVPQQVDLTAGEEEIEDPRNELVQKLLEYKRYKEAALTLEARRTERGRVFERGEDRPIEKPEPSDEPGELDVELWDLVEAFARIVREVGSGRVLIPFSDDDRPVREYMEEIVGRMHRTRGFFLDEIVAGASSRMHVVSYFMAILELMRGRRIRATQSEAFGRIRIEPPDPEEDVEPVEPVESSESAGPSEERAPVESPAPVFDSAEANDAMHEAVETKPDAAPPAAERDRP